jgi:hypothetical protein
MISKKVLNDCKEQKIITDEEIYRIKQNQMLQKIKREKEKKVDMKWQNMFDCVEYKKNNPDSILYYNTDENLFYIKDKIFQPDWNSRGEFLPKIKTMIFNNFKIDFI